MKIILLEDVGALGKLGDIVAVRAGYARNYLFPQGKAERASAEAARHFEARRAELEDRQRLQVESTERARASLDGYLLQLSARASPEGNLYGSITPQHIAIALNGQNIVDGLVIRRGQVLLPDGALKMVGEHKIGVHLRADCEAEITVSVLAENDDDAVGVKERS